MWNRQRTDEVLLDVHDIALGHTTKMRWNDLGKRIYSEQIAHPPIVDDAAFQRAQDLLAARRGIQGPHKTHRSNHKAEIYTQLGLRLTHHPSSRTVRAEAKVSGAQHWQFESVRGPIDPIPPPGRLPMQAEVDL